MAQLYDQIAIDRYVRNMYYLYPPFNRVPSPLITSSGCARATSSCDYFLIVSFPFVWVHSFRPGLPLK